ncbi:hypothetical protein NQ317_006183 [Molorchus minor]|uniref:E3 ubiquitin-protein ligase n=1 Tax=Molorchus minor TaxID=1323400 RepID=A0ABQ9J0A3_9CUCU|nr:hypothetical protein NQ317_006183 [Molorchus minor]
MYITEVKTAQAHSLLIDKTNIPSQREKERENEEDFEGHSICSSCWKGLATCPSCNKDLSKTRNYSLESLVEIIFYPCRNSDYGCSEFLKLNEIDDHLNLCSFRNYRCRFEECDWEGKRTQIEDHYLMAHQQSVIVGPDNLCWWKNKEYDVYTIDRHLMLAHKELFFVHRKVVDNFMYWVVQYIGKSEDVIQYYYQINIFSDQYQNRRVCISENCQDDLKMTSPK